MHLLLALMLTLYLSTALPLSSHLYGHHLLCHRHARSHSRQVVSPCYLQRSSGLEPFRPPPTHGEFAVQQRPVLDLYWLHPLRSIRIHPDIRVVCHKFPVKVSSTDVAMLSDGGSLVVVSRWALANLSSSKHCRRTDGTRDVVPHSRTSSAARSCRVHQTR